MKREKWKINVERWKDRIRGLSGPVMHVELNGRACVCGRIRRLMPCGFERECVCLKRLLNASNFRHFAFVWIFVQI